MTDLHALIIDDQPGNIDVLALLLQNEGVSHTAITSPRNLADTLEQLGQADVVFLDLEFPNGNGFDMLAELQAHPLLSGIPIVAYTVHVSEIDRARSEGFHSFLGKPLDTRRFPDQLRRILNNEPVWEISSGIE